MIAMTLQEKKIIEDFCVAPFECIGVVHGVDTFSTTQTKVSGGGSIVNGQGHVTVDSSSITQSFTNFWIKQFNGLDRAFVGPARIPLADGHRVEIHGVEFANKLPKSQKNDDYEDVHFVFVFFVRDTNEIYYFKATKYQGGKISLESIDNFGKLAEHYKKFTSVDGDSLYKRTNEALQKIRRKGLPIWYKLLTLISVILAIGGWFITRTLGVIGVLASVVCTFLPIFFEESREAEGYAAAKRGEIESEFLKLEEKLKGMVHS